MSRIEFKTDITETFETADDTAKYIMDYVLDNYEEVSFIGDSEIVNAVLTSLIEVCDYGNLNANIDVNDVDNLYGVSLDENCNIHVSCIGNAQNGYGIDFDGRVLIDSGTTPLSYLARLFKYEIEFDIVEIEEFADTFEPLYKADQPEENEFDIDSSSLFALRTPDGSIVIYYS